MLVVGGGVVVKMRDDDKYYRAQPRSVDGSYRSPTTVLRGHLPELRPESWILQSPRAVSSAQRLVTQQSTHHGRRCIKGSVFCEGER